MSNPPHTQATHFYSAVIWSHFLAVITVYSLCHSQHIVSKAAGGSCFGARAIRPQHAYISLSTQRLILKCIHPWEWSPSLANTQHRQPDFTQHSSGKQIWPSYLLFCMCLTQLTVMNSETQGCLSSARERRAAYWSSPVSIITEPFL
jgi:hypothetical protein